MVTKFGNKNGTWAWFDGRTLASGALPFVPNFVPSSQIYGLIPPQSYTVLTQIVVFHQTWATGGL